MAVLLNCEFHSILDTQAAAPWFLKISFEEPLGKISRNALNKRELIKRTSISDPAASLSSSPGGETDKVLAMAERLSVERNHSCVKPRPMK